MDFKPRIDELNAELDKMQVEYNEEHIKKEKDFQKMANIAFAIVKREAKVRALSFLNGLDKVQKRSYPQYSFLCPNCGKSVSFHVKEVARACQIAHTDLKTARSHTYLCNFAQTDKGILTPHDMDFEAFIEELKKYDEEFRKN